ncbi:hypothetical protein Forpe1208_v011963 [Fusarium oxysporum f. sp. rapae]|uniref:Uncharacterized protein n=1 Tax=Fusarium oxysporum f. sp. rapae TaxID=485398 RepID=A0A8J5NNN3_FUSOX|nr:hypothetical protein Forpe1208_v011963 [Fusarium oxysporum f. sp. rapae]
MTTEEAKNFWMPTYATAPGYTNLPSLTWPDFQRLGLLTYRRELGGRRKQMEESLIKPVAEEAASGIITADQTLGPARKRHAEPFNGSIGDFTQGHSVRWQVVMLYTWALPKTEGG